MAAEGSAQLSEAGQHGLDVALGIINRLRGLDPPRVFWEPVVGVVGYAEKIKHPMSFRVMENKLRAREYRTWRSLVADFELICANAKTFNSPNSQIWKLAGQLQRAGRKLLQAEELAGRRALYDLHPQGPRGAAADEEAHVLRDAAETARLSSLLVGGGAAAAAALAGRGAVATTAAAAAAVAAGAPHASRPSAAGGGEDAAAAGPPLPVPPDEDAMAAARLWEPDEWLPQPNDWGLLFREAPEPNIDAVIQQSRLAALYLPYGATGSGGGGGGGNGAGADAVTGGQAGGATAGQQREEQQEQLKHQQQQHRRQQNPQQQQVQPEPQAGSTSVQQQQQQQQQQEQQGHDGPAADGQQQRQGQEQQVKPDGDAGPSVPSPTNRQPKLPPSGRSAGWKAVRRPVEWRARWLELRLLELGNLISQLRAAPCSATRSGTAAAAAAAAAAAVAAGSGGAAATTGPSGGGSGMACLGGGSGSGADVQAPMALAQRGGMLLPQHLDAHSRGSVLAAPFFGAHASPPSTEQALQMWEAVAAARAARRHGDSLDGSREGGQQQQQQQEQGQQEEAYEQQVAAAALAAPGAAAPEDGTAAGWEAGAAARSTEAAAVFGSLDIVEKQLVDVRLRLASMFGIEVSAAPSGVRLGLYAASRLAGRRGLEQFAQYGGSGGAGGGGGGAAARLAREGSASLKRRRVGSSVLDEELVLSPTAPRILERPVVNIHIPPVRELPPDQLKARLAAMTAWSQAYQEHGDAALARPPPDVTAVIEAMGESSSEEGSGDEWYRALHRSMEEEEARRLSGYAGGGAQRGRNQNKAASAAGDGGDGGPSDKRGAPDKRCAPEKRGSSSGALPKPPPKPPSKPPPKPAGAAWLATAPPVAAEAHGQQLATAAAGSGSGGPKALDSVGDAGAADGLALGSGTSGAAVQAATPTVVKRATASGPAAAALKRAGSGSLATRSASLQQQQDMPAQAHMPQPAPQQAQQPQQPDSQGRSTRQQAAQQAQKAAATRPARTPR